MNLLGANKLATIEQRALLAKEMTEKILKASSTPVYNQAGMYMAVYPVVLSKILEE